MYANVAQVLFVSSNKLRLISFVRATLYLQHDLRAAGCAGWDVAVRYPTVRNPVGITRSVVGVATQQSW